MLDVSRLARGNLQLSKSTVTAQEVVRRSVETTRSLIAARGHTLQVAAPDAPIELFADGGRLEQVVTNLLTNAAKYTPPDGKIEVELMIDNGEAVIRVRDNGEGISADLLPQIVEMFTQAPQHRGHGLGIGLALAKTLVELHSGRLKAHSDGPGKGSEFVCCLPLASAAERVVAPALPVTPLTTPGNRYGILVIDDQVDALYELCLLLKLFGHDVHVAHSGPEGIAEAERVRPHVVLLDISMPGMDGYETARRLRKQPEMEQALIVAMTGYSQSDVHERAMQAGFDHHLAKPVSFETVQKLLAERQRAPAQPWN
jgi:two-component system CheB/CheR fusion protein